MAILVAADFSADEWALWWPLLVAALPGESLLRDRREAPVASIDVALVANPALGSLRDLPKLRLIQSLWAGVDRLLDDASVPAQVPLARMVDPAMNQSMAQTALWAVLGVQRDFLDYARQQRARLWQPLPLRRPDEVEIAVLGLGQMGRAAARLLGRHGYRVTGWSRGAITPIDPIDTIAASDATAAIELRHGDAALAEVLARSQIVVNLLPLTPHTRGLFNAARLGQLPRGASLVNLARGGHVVDADLLDALDRGQLRHAVLDVFATEPLPSEHRFWSHPSVTVLPHVAAPTDPRSAARIAARNVEALRAGGPLEHLVDRSRGY